MVERNNISHHDTLKRNGVMLNHISPDKFETLVREFYGFLESDFGYSMRKINNWEIQAETQDTRVIFQLEHYASLVIEIEPIGKGASQLLKKNILPESMTILSICKFYEPEMNYKPERLDEKNFVDNVPVELKRQGELLKKYCSGILQGDYSDWPKITKYLTEL